MTEVTRQRIESSRKAGTAAVGFSSEIILRLLSGALGVPAVALLTRSLRPADLGVYSLWTVAVAFVSTVIELAQRPLMLRDLASGVADSANMGRYVWSRLVYAAGWGVLFAGIALLTVDHSQRVAVLIIIASILVTPISCFSVIAHAHYRGDLVGIGVLVQSLLWTGGLILVHFESSGLLGVSIALVMANLLSSSCVVVLCLRFMPLRVVRGHWRARGQRGADSRKFLASAVAMLAAWKADLPAVYAVVSERSAGFYAASYRVLDLLIMIPTTLANIYTKSLTEADSENRSARRLIGIGVVGSCCIPIAFIPFAHLAARVLFGEQYKQSPSIMVVLLGALPLITFRYLLAAIFVQHNAGSKYIRTSFAYLAVAVALVFSLGALGGVRAAALATPMAEVSFVGVAWFFADVRVLIQPFRMLLVASFCVALTTTVAGMMM